MACLRACVLCVFMCLRAYVLSVLLCLLGYVLGVISVHACLRAWCASAPVCVLVMWNVLFFYVFTYLVFFLSYLLYIAKNLSALLSWTYFLFTFWYQLIKLFETNLRVAGKSIDISCSYSCSKAISIFYNLYIHLLH